MKRISEEMIVFLLIALIVVAGGIGLFKGTADAREKDYRVKMEEQAVKMEAQTHTALFERAKETCLNNGEIHQMRVESDGEVYIQCTEEENDN